MTPESVMALGYQAIKIGMALSLPLLLSALACGLLISLFQASTQINEMTLSFIPKILAVAATAVCAGPWMLHLFIEYVRTLYQNLPGMIG